MFMTTGIEKTKGLLNNFTRWVPCGRIINAKSVFIKLYLSFDKNIKKISIPKYVHKHKTNVATFLVIKILLLIAFYSFACVTFFHFINIYF